MKKFKVELREVIYTDIEVEANSLEEAYRIIKKGGWDGATKINEETGELTAVIKHDDGEMKVSLIV